MATREGLAPPRPIIATLNYLGLEERPALEGDDGRPGGLEGGELAGMASPLNPSGDLLNNAKSRLFPLVDARCALKDPDLRPRLPCLSSVDEAARDLSFRRNEENAPLSRRLPLGRRSCGGLMGGDVGVLDSSDEALANIVDIKRPKDPPGDAEPFDLRSDFGEPLGDFTPLRLLTSLGELLPSGGKILTDSEESSAADN